MTTLEINLTVAIWSLASAVRKDKGLLIGTPSSSSLLLIRSQLRGYISASLGSCLLCLLLSFYNDSECASKDFHCGSASHCTIHLFKILYIQCFFLPVELSKIIIMVKIHISFLHDTAGYAISLSTILADLVIEQKVPIIPQLFTYPIVGKEYWEGILAVSHPKVIK